MTIILKFQVPTIGSPIQTVKELLKLNEDLEMNEVDEEMTAPVILVDTDEKRLLLEKVLIESALQNVRNKIDKLKLQKL